MTAADPQPVDTAARLRMLTAPSRDGDWVRVRAGELRAVADELDRLCATVATMRAALNDIAMDAKHRSGLAERDSQHDQDLTELEQRAREALRDAPAETDQPEEP